MEFNNEVLVKVLCVYGIIVLRLLLNTARRVPTLVSFSHSIPVVFFVLTSSCLPFPGASVVGPGSWHSQSSQIPTLHLSQYTRNTQCNLQTCPLNFVDYLLHTYILIHIDTY